MMTLEFTLWELRVLFEGKSQKTAWHFNIYSLCSSGTGNPNKEVFHLSL